ncbi:MAG TPA: hypothetical protein ENH34_05100 [Phycisphaerales bacterium]|nr:hypothetical protein [Phycisphaerales bacterium]
MRKLIVIWTCLLFTIPCEADTFIVDPNGFEDFNNIQDAINYSWHGDTVIVRPGTYNENIYFNGRAITLTSENPNDPNVVDSTIITANSGYSVTFDFGENSDSVLAGFTITGRGIYCYASSPTIKNNIIRDCDNYGISGGQGAAPIISDNSISNIFSAGIFNCHGPINNNIVSGNRRGISECDGSITYNKIANNAYGGAGAGLYDCDGTIANNIILGNEVTSGSGGGGGGLSNCNGNIINNIISGNKAVTGGGGLSDCTNVFNNTIVGNIANTGAALSGCDFISNTS